MVSYSFWQSHLGGNPAAVGETIRVDGKSRQIIGIMPKEFRFLDWEPPALFLPLVLDRNKTTLGQFSYEGVARLRPGVTLRAANEDVGRMWPIVLRSFPAPPGFNLDLFAKSRLAPKVRPLSQDVIGDVSKLL
jgi:MacB-like periplasmic core domain